jgi:DNA-3-methyladenine glycosylase II
VSRRLSYSPSSREVRALADDPVMARVVDGVGELSVAVEADAFVALASAIVGQQLSTKAAETIWARFAALGPMTPHAVLGLASDELRAVGLSGAKARYVRDLAEHFATGELDATTLDDLSDEQVVAEVTRVKGVGRWTAEMFLVFSLARPDVLALDDAGLLRAGGWALGLGGAATGLELAEAGESWRPYRSVASLYLWGALDRGLVPRTAGPGGLTPRDGG